MDEKEEKQAIGEVNQLVSELRQNFEDFQKGILTKADFEEIRQKYEERLDEVETKLNLPPAPAQPETKDEAKEIEFKSFFKWVKNGKSGLAPEELKTMKISDDVAGGYLAPIQLQTRIIEVLTQISPIRQISQVETIGVSGIEFPKEGTDTVTAAWPDETLVAGDYKFEMEKLEPHELRALVTPKRTLLEDSFFNIEDWITRQTAKKFAKKEGTAFVSGAGPSRPEGLLTNTEIGEVVSGDASTLTADGIISLFYGLPSDYRPNAKFVLNNSSIKAVRLFKDENNQYLWQPSYQAGQPAALLGRPVVEAVDMPDVGAGTYPILFGDFKAGYLIVDRTNMAVQRLAEVYATQGLVGFLFWKRVDAQVILAEAIKKQKVAAS
jgi:HK97 family phage major capsid protein